MSYETLWVSDKGEQYIGDVSLTKIAARAEQMLRERRQRYCSCHWNSDLCGVHALTARLRSDLHYEAVIKIVSYYGGDLETAHEWAEILS